MHSVIPGTEAVGFAYDCIRTGKRHKWMSLYYILCKHSIYPSHVIFEQGRASTYYAMLVSEYVDHKLSSM